MGRADSVVGAVAGTGDVAWALRPTTDQGARGPRDPRADRALVRAAQRGDADALERLFRRHWGMAHRAAYLVVHDAAAAEDIAQEAFLAAVRALDRFDRGRPFGPWLHRIVVNRAIDHTRARALRREVALAEPPDVRTTGGEAAGEQEARHDEVVAALAALPGDQRAVVVLRHLLEYTPGEIARLLDLPRGTVNSRLRRGLDEMARRMDPPDSPDVRDSPSVAAAPDPPGSPRGAA
jgi:RNA polymerase sigma-70 factor (ECF subfamily)